MAITWPVTLPPLSQLQNIQGNPGKKYVESSMDEGPPKRRFKTDAEPGTLSGHMTMTFTEYQDLLTFYETTLGGGALSFDDTHPVLGVTKTFRLNEPEWSGAGGPLLTVQIDMEVLN